MLSTVNQMHAYRYGTVNCEVFGCAVAESSDDHVSFVRKLAPDSPSLAAAVGTDHYQPYSELSATRMLV